MASAMEEFRIKKTPKVKVLKFPRQKILPSREYGELCLDKCKFINDARLICQNKTKLALGCSIAYDTLFNQLSDEERKLVNYWSVIRVSNSHKNEITDDWHISVWVCLLGKTIKFHYPTANLPTNDGQTVLVVDYAGVERLNTIAHSY